MSPPPSYSTSIYFKTELILSSPAETPEGWILQFQGEPIIADNFVIFAENFPKFADNLDI